MFQSRESQVILLPPSQVASHQNSSPSDSDSGPHLCLNI